MTQGVATLSAVPAGSGSDVAQSLGAVVPGASLQSPGVSHRAAVRAVGLGKSTGAGTTTAAADSNSDSEELWWQGLVYEAALAGSGSALVPPLAELQTIALDASLPSLAGGAGSVTAPGAPPAAHGDQSQSTPEPHEKNVNATNGTAATSYVSGSGFESET